MSIVNLQPESSAAFLSSWKELTKAPITTMVRETVFLAMGSNLGDRGAMLQQAIDAVHALSDTEVVHCSSVYETEPWGDVAQDRFYNCAVEIRTALQPMQLLTAVKNIEKAMGRLTVHRNGPRIIDIDILLYGSIILAQDGLSIPHPAMHERPFVLIPLRDIAAGVMHPVESHTIGALADRCGESEGVVGTGLALCLPSEKASSDISAPDGVNRRD